MSSTPFARYSQALLAAFSSCLVFASESSFPNEKVCRLVEQRYEQIEKGANSIEINATLFSVAEKGCKELAQHLLDAGASLEARDRFGIQPLGRAAAAGQGEIVALFLERGAPIDARAIENELAEARVVPRAGLDAAAPLLVLGAVEHP